MSWRSSSVVQIYSSHLTFYHISGNRVDPYPFVSHPGNPTLDIFLFPLQLEDYQAFISIYIGAADISYYFELLTRIMNDGFPD
jgi:hypothetical protein